MSRALLPALTLCACIATVGLSACSAASTDGSGNSVSSDAHGLTSAQSGAPTAQSGSSGGLYESGYLQLGQCLLAAPQEGVPLELVDCTQEHGAEVIHTFDLTMTTMPSEDTLEEVSDETCGEAFTAYVAPFETPRWTTSGDCPARKPGQLVIDGSSASPSRETRASSRRR